MATVTRDYKGELQYVDVEVYARNDYAIVHPAIGFKSGEPTRSKKFSELSDVDGQLIFRFEVPEGFDYGDLVRVYALLFSTIDPDDLVDQKGVEYANALSDLKGYLYHRGIDNDGKLLVQETE